VPSDPKLDRLRQCLLFSGLSGREIERVGQLTEEVHLPADRVLMRQGDVGREMFVVAEGRVRVERDGRTIDESGPGEVLGEMALLSEGPRTATVTTTEPSRLYVLGQHEFHVLMDEMPSVRDAIVKVLADRLRSLDRDAAH
jgi:CRP-like cAMP-binding protein